MVDLDYFSEILLWETMEPFDGDWPPGKMEAPCAVLGLVFVKAILLLIYAFLVILKLDLRLVGIETC